MESISFLCLMFIFSVLVVHFLFGKTYFSRRAKLLNKFPGPPSVPLLGNAHNLMLNGSNITKYTAAMFKEYGSTFRTWIFQTPYLITADYKIAEAILSSSKQIEIGSPILNKYFGDGLIGSEGQQWRKDRKELNPSFSQNSIKIFLEVFNSNADILINDLKKKFLPMECEKFQNIMPVLGRSALNSVFESSMGKLAPEFQEIGTKQIVKKALVAILKGIRIRVSKPWLALSPFLWRNFGNGALEKAHLHPFRKEMIRQIDAKISSPSIEDPESKTFVDILLKGRNRNAQNIYNHIVSLLLAGIDTTSNAMNFALFLLANNPHHLKKVQEELDRIFKDKTCNDVRMGELADMKYLEMCIKETLRMYPPAPFLPRKLVEDVELENKFVIPQGCNVIIMTYDFHRNPKVYPNPDKFDPERFAPESKRPQFAYIPFSAGGRNCIGKKFAMIEIKLFLSRLLSTFDVTAAKSPDQLELDYSVAHLKLCLKPRDNVKLN